MSLKPLPNERRQDIRTPLLRPAKIRCRQTGKYYQGKTCNISDSGALIEIKHPSLMVAGQQRVAVLFEQRQQLAMTA